MLELSILLTIVGGWILLTYRFFAQGAGYPIGEIFYKDWPIFLGGISLIGAIYSAFSQLGLFWTIGLLIAGILGSFLALTTFKSMSGFLAFVCIIVGYVLLFLV